MLKPLLSRLPVALITVGFASLSPLAHSTSICRWVDDAGRTQMSDIVPDRYKNASSCTDSKKYELSTEKKSEVEQRAVEAQLRQRQELSAPPAKASSSSSGSTEDATLPLATEAKRPTEVITDDTDCPTRWRIYDESAECFGPYKTTRGATKPEAFDKCIDIPSPEPMCGPRRN